MTTFERCAPEQIGSLQTFFAKQYSSEYILARNRDFLVWQFGSAPGTQGQGLDVKLAIVDGEIAGCVGYVPVSLSLGGNDVRGAWAANWMVDDRFRKLGLGPLLMRELCRDFDVTLALGGNRDAHALLPRMGWTDFGDLPRFVGVIDRQAAGRLTEAGTLPEVPAVDTTVRDGIARVDSFDERVEEVWDRDYRHMAGTRRTAAFLNWRYAAHPVFEYRLFVSSEGPSVGGFAVYRVERVANIGRVGRIVELIGESSHAAALLSAVANDAKNEGVSMLDFFCPDDRRRPVLAEAGFIPGSEQPGSLLPMLFQPIDRSRAGVLFMAHVRQAKPDAWYVTTADGDQDRPN